MHWPPGRLGVFFALALAATPATPQSSPTDTAGAVSPHRSLQAYAGLGLSVSPEPQRALAGGVAYRTGSNIWAVRGARNAQLGSQDIWDVGLLYGRPIGAGDRGWVGAGVAAVGGEFEQCSGGFFVSNCSTESLWPTLSVPVEAHLVLFPRGGLGVDIVAFVNFNDRLPFAGLAAAVRVGSGGAQSADASRGTAESTAWTASTDSALQPGAPLRVTYCAADCGLPRLVVTGRFAGFQDGSLRMDPGARLRVRVRQPGMAGNYPVVRLAEDAVWIGRRNEPTRILLPSGWTAGSDGLSIPFQGATKVEVRALRPPGAGALRGGIVGGAAGALVLALGGLLAAEPDDLFGPAEAALFGASIGLIGGAPLGAIIGAIFPGTRWEDASDRLPQLPGPPGVIPRP